MIWKKHNVIQIFVIGIQIWKSVMCRFNVLQYYMKFNANKINIIIEIVNGLH